MRALASATFALLTGCGMVQTSSGEIDDAERRWRWSGTDPDRERRRSERMVTMPNLVGKTEAEANAMLAAAGFKSSLEHSAPVDCGDSAPKDEGKMNRQSVAAGSQTQAYTLVQVNIYAPHHFEGMLVRHQLEPLVGMSVEAGKAELR